jgi:hypothetical protein
MTLDLSYKAKTSSQLANKLAYMHGIQRLVTVFNKTLY